MTQKLLLILLFYISILAQTYSQNDEYRISSGSGIIINEGGYIVTCHHVIESGKEIDVEVQKDGVKSIYKAIVVSKDTINDLAILKIMDAKFNKFEPIPFTLKPYNIKVGEEVFTMGYPNRNIQGDEVKVTNGIISSKTGYLNENRTYQISAPIQSGNSGGPLFDKSGNLIGITNAGIPNADNVSYAIKISYLFNSIDAIDNFPEISTNSKIVKSSLPLMVQQLSEFVVSILVKKEKCNLETPYNDFYNLRLGVPYKEVANRLGIKGELSVKTKNFEQYKWTFCDAENTIICQFNNGMLTSKVGSIFIGCTKIPEERIRNIKEGQTYEQIQRIIGTKGNLQIENNDSQFKQYLWKICDSNKKLVVQFRDNRMIGIVKY